MVNVKNNKVFDVANGKDGEGTNVIVFNKHAGLNQQWDIVYIDDIKPELSIGDFHPEFGFYIGKEFSLVSKWGGRYLDAIGGNVVVKSRSASKSQKWYFDITTRTIINVQYKKSIDVTNSGKGKKVQIW
jgi:hypothetical protein